MSRSRLAVLLLVVVAVAAAGFGVWWWFFCAPPVENVTLTAVAFTDLPGWQASDLSGALAAFRRSCAGHIAGEWRSACDTASGTRDARSFFEGNFTPYAIGPSGGLVTGYYEPLLNGSRTRHGPYQTPVYGLPGDLVSIDLGQFRPEWRGETISGRLVGHSVAPYPARAEIDARPPAKTRVLFYGDDPVSVFYLHIQGSGRVWLDDGSMLRVTYAGQNGHPYTAIGRVLIARGALSRETVSMQSIRAWLMAHPGEARPVMESDASFVFFKEAPIGDAALGPEGSAGVVLTPRASIAVDPKFHPFGTPVFIAGGGIANLFIAQDTGGAIKGAVRADIFFGFGAGAESAAGTMKARAYFYVLYPKGAAPKLPT
ncbi:MAG: murein transglycosylase A [Rhizomicrobium sp.]